MSGSHRELRIALVLNGGVSLAVWIGGVVHEIDRLRRAFSDDEDASPYREKLEELGYDAVRVDVIAGASAGGINGALLAAAIQGGMPLRGAGGESLRDVWVGLGDLARITRGPRLPGDTSLPSVLSGDEMVQTLTTILSSLLVADSESPLATTTGAHASLNLYMTTTDLQGQRRARFTTSADPIEEMDHRIIFRFSSNANDDFNEILDESEGLVERMVLEQANAGRLALAARASSSFPVAFSPVKVPFRRGGGAPVVTYMVDGGILDNQPFNPVLDRITQLPVDGPWRRAICYVVPYVTEGPGSAEPTLAEVATSGGLARDLPKLESLQRIESERQRGSLANYAIERLGENFSELIQAAESLLPVYRRIQAAELIQTALAWQQGPVESGDGPTGESDSTSREEIVTPPVPPEVAGLEGLVASLLPAPEFNVAAQGWEENDQWTWGLSKAERFARTALAWAGTSERSTQEPVASADAVAAVRQASSALSTSARRAIRARRVGFQQLVSSSGTGAPPLDAFVESYWAVDAERTDVAGAVALLCGQLAVMFNERGDPVSADGVLRRLAAVEVVRHAAGTRSMDPPVFDFYRFSARTPRVFDASSEPELPRTKLAGMGLMHFAAFLKQSWRANDWMMGRLDGAYWIDRMLDEATTGAFREELAIGILREELPALAAAARNDENAGFASDSDVAVWRRSHEQVLQALEGDGEAGDDADVIQVFQAWGLAADGFTKELGSNGGKRTVDGLAKAAFRCLEDPLSYLPSRFRQAVKWVRRLGGPWVTKWLVKTFKG